MTQVQTSENIDWKKSTSYVEVHMTYLVNLYSCRSAGVIAGRQTNTPEPNQFSSVDVAKQVNYLPPKIYTSILHVVNYAVSSQGAAWRQMLPFSCKGIIQINIDNVFYRWLSLYK